jgi:surface polysaccharide O-acyltransferase-like enzyme
MSNASGTQTDRSASPTTGPDAQPHDRELSADLYRVVAVVFVVVGHWLAAAVTFRNGLLGNDTVLAVLPWTQWLTWIFQVVPVFFLVAGYANAVAWARWRDNGARRQDWYRHRLAGVLGPATVYVAVVLAVVTVLLRVRVNSSEVALGTWAVAMHLWFIPVFIVVVSLTPFAVTAHQRWGLAALGGTALAVASVDALSLWAQMALVGWLNYLLCWAAFYQIGIVWHGRGLRGRRPLLLALIAAAVLTILVTVGRYPVSMIGVAGARVQNTTPPTIALLAFGTVQSGLLVAAAPAITRWLRRPRRRRAVALANANVMGLYLWHMVPVIVVAVIGYPAGLLPQPALGSGAWWQFRAVWVAVLSIVTAAELALLWWWRRVFRRAVPHITVGLPVKSSTPLLITGVALVVLTMWRFAVGGFAPHSRFPVIGALLYAAGVALIILVPGGVNQRRPILTKT